jgi:hypothetical protein
MRRFKSTSQAWNFLFAHAFIYGHFHLRRHRLTASAYRQTLLDAFRIWLNASDDTTKPPRAKLVVRHQPPPTAARRLIDSAIRERSARLGAGNLGVRLE